MNTPTPITNPQFAGRIVLDPSTGTGAVAHIIAGQPSGAGGRCYLALPNAITAAGPLVAVQFPPGFRHTPESRTTNVQFGAVTVGSFLDPDVRPIVLTAWPALPEGIVFTAVPVMEPDPTPTPGQTVHGARMAGFVIHTSGPLPATSRFIIAWAVL